MSPTITELPTCRGSCHALPWGCTAGGGGAGAGVAAGPGAAPPQHREPSARATTVSDPMLTF